MANARKSSGRKTDAAPAPMSREAAREARAKAMAKAPAVRDDINPEGSWPFPSGPES